MPVEKRVIATKLKTRGSFTMVPNELWRVEGLDSTARDIWSYIYSMPEDWQSSRNNIARNLRMGLHTVTNRLATLEEVGLLKIEKEGNKPWHFTIIEPDGWCRGGIDANQHQCRDSITTDAATASQLMPGQHHIQYSILQKEDIADSVDEKEKSPTGGYEEIVNFWNATVAGPKVKHLSTSRKKKLKARFKENLFLENWKQIIQDIAANRFLSGENDRGWKASFDWLIENDSNYLKVLEGKYNDSAQMPSEKKVDWS